MILGSKVEQRNVMDVGETARLVTMPAGPPGTRPAAADEDDDGPDGVAAAPGDGGHSIQTDGAAVSKAERHASTKSTTPASCHSTATAVDGEGSSDAERRSMSETFQLECSYQSKRETQTNNPNF